MVFVLTIFIPYIIAIVVGIVVRICEYRSYNVIRTMRVVEVQSKKIKPYGWFQEEDIFFTYKYKSVGNKDYIYEDKYWINTMKLDEGAIVDIWCKKDKNELFVLCDRERIKEMIKSLFGYLLIVSALMSYFLIRL